MRKQVRRFEVRSVNKDGALSKMSMSISYDRVSDAFVRCAAVAKLNPGSRFAVLDNESRSVVVPDGEWAISEAGACGKTIEIRWSATQVAVVERAQAQANERGVPVVYWVAGYPNDAGYCYPKAVL